MQRDTVDIIIHTHQPLTHDTFNTIVQRLGPVDGLVKFERHSSNPRLIMMAYDAGRMRALSILKILSGHGIHASLVGI